MDFNGSALRRLLAWHKASRKCIIPLLPEHVSCTYGLQHSKMDFRTIAYVSFQISLSSPRRLIRNDTFRFMYFFFFFKQDYFGAKCNAVVRKVPTRISLCGLRRLIQDDNLRKCPNVRFRVLPAILYVSLTLPECNKLKHRTNCKK